MIDVKLIPKQPFAIAFSGGGDSTALVHKLRSHKPYIFIVDHKLRPDSFKDIQQAAQFSRRLELKTEILNWDHGLIETGLQEKARKARYRLLGGACRRNGIKHLLTAHTRDDQAETLLMRFEKSTDWRGAVGMREKTYGPVWPELAEVHVIRPLLKVSRAELRNYNRTHGLNWAEDPSNENMDFKRVWARQHLLERLPLKQDLLDAAHDIEPGFRRERALFHNFSKAHLEIDAFGLIHLDSTPPPALLGELCRIAGGTGGPVDRVKARALARAMKAESFAGRTLSGGLVMPWKGGFVIGPDPVIYKGRRNREFIRECAFPPYEPLIWGGRFLLKTMRKGLRVRPLGEDRTILSDIQRQVLQQIPPIFRGAMPVIANINDDVFGCPGGVAGHPDVDMYGLVQERLNALWDF